MNADPEETARAILGGLSKDTAPEESADLDTEEAAITAASDEIGDALDVPEEKRAALGAALRAFARALRPKAED